MKKLQTLILIASLFCGISSVQAVERIDVSAAPYNADCTDDQDDSNAISSAVAAALAARVPLYIPPGPPGAGCRYNSTIQLTKMIPIIGEGQAVSRLLYCGSGSAIKILPPTNQTDNRGQIIRDISIDPCTSGGGTYGIEVALGANAFYAYFDISNISIGDFGTRGLSLNNDINNTDGFFNGRVANSFISNGILGTNIGDSLTFDHVVVHGKNNVDLSGVPGARLVSFIGGQITTQNGFLILRHVNGFRARDVWMETPGNDTSDSAVAVFDSGDAIFEGLVINVIQGVGQPAQVFALVGAHDTKIINTSFLNKGTAAHIYGTSSTSNTRIEGNNYNGYTPVNILQGS